MSMANIFLLVCTAFFTLPNVIYADELGDSIEQVFSGLVNNASDNPEFLDPDEAFILSTKISDHNILEFSWKIADGYYLYRDNFRFEPEHNEDITLGHAEISKGEIKEDPDFGRVEVLHRQAMISIPVSNNNTNESVFNMTVTYQGCKEDVICYPPVNKDLTFYIPAGLPGNVIKNYSTTSEHNEITNRLAQKNILFSILIFFGFGLLAAFSACVYPMIPILSGIIIGQNKQISTHRAFMLSVAYVFPIAITYAFIGIISAQLGYNLQAASQNAWVISLFSAIFVILALSMFGFYELRIPDGWHTKLSSLGNKQKSGSYLGAVIMGILSAIIVGPCVTPPLFAAITYIGQTGDILLGGTTLFAFGLGMGTPLLAIGASMGKLLPRAGAWMKSIQKIFGVIMLAVAIWFLERVIPGPVALILWALLLITTALYMGALDSLPSNARWQKLWKATGLLILVYGILLVIGAANGNDNLFKPLDGLVNNSDKEVNTLEFNTIKSVADLDNVLAGAIRTKQIVMLDFYADWCIDCKKMEKQTFSNEQVQASLDNIILLRADVTQNDDLDRALLNKFSLPGPPAILFFDDNGLERREYRIIGFLDPEKFSKHINRIKTL